MLKRILAFFVLMQLTIACFSEDVHQKNKVFIVGVTSFEYAPHYFMDGDRFSGFGRDVLDLFAKKSGYEFKYQPRPYVRMVKELLTGEIDFQYPDNPNWLTEQKNGHTLFYSNGVIQYIDGIIRWKSDLGKPLSTLKRIAMPRGWTPTDYLPLVRRGELIIEEEDQVGAVIDMLRHNRVDGSYLNIDVANYYLESHKIFGQIDFDPSLPYQFSQYSLSSILHPQIIKEFNQFLIDSAAEIQQIKVKYKFRFDTDPIKKRK